MGIVGYDDNTDKTAVQDSAVTAMSGIAQKAVSNAGYDKTIIATIQTCTDASQGQYRIKYQDSYFTAYSKDTTKTYMNNAVVYVQIPENNTSNRMFITGLATDNKNQQKSVTILEPDQQFTNKSPSFISIKSGADIGMSSYWSAPGLHEKVLYNTEEDQTYGNYLDVDNEKFLNYVNQLETPYMRIGLSVKTALEETRKEGNYGFRVSLKYEGEENYRDYVIETGNMSGNPYNFTSAVPQYEIWQIDKEKLIGIARIEEFMEGFPEGTPTETSPEKDIFFQDISLVTCEKIYNEVNDNSIQVGIIAEKGTVFNDRDKQGLGSNAVFKELPFEASLLYHGNIIDIETNGIEIYWGREDATITKPSDYKYNDALGVGWYCLNTANRIKDENADWSALQDPEYATMGVNDEAPQDEFIWVSQPKITLNVDNFLGKQTNLKVAIKYENSIYTKVITITNKKGLYLLMGPTDNQQQFHNSYGNISLVAGVFKDVEDAEAPVECIASGTTEIKNQQTPFTVTYKWSKQDSYETNTKKSLPVDTVEYYPNSPLAIDNLSKWNSSEDNETKTETEVDTYFTTDFTDITAPIARRCYERYIYYNDRLNRLLETPEPTDPQEKEVYNTKLQRCKDRLEGSNEVTGIKPANLDFINNLYRAETENNEGYYIIGDGSVVAQYDQEKIQNDSDYQNYFNYASIVPGTTVYNYGNTSLQNVVYKIKGAYIDNYTDFSVTAFIHYTLDGEQYTQSVGTKTYRLINRIGEDVNYYLEIVNGQQIFFYDEAGKRTSKEFKTLYFKFYNKEGQLLYDSTKTEMETQNDINLTILQPKWKFPYKNTLIRTFYTAEEDDDPTVETNINCYQDGDVNILANQPMFDYSILDTYNLDYTDNDIELEVTYKDSTISTSTSFNFVKQGDIGTNGTDYVLLVQDEKYEQYKNNTLNLDEWSIVEGKRYSPDSRHLQNVYLYASDAYGGDKVTTAFDFINDDGENGGVIPIWADLSFGNIPDSGQAQMTEQLTTSLRAKVFTNGSSLEDSQNDVSINWMMSPTLENDNLQFENSFFLKSTQSSQPVKARTLAIGAKPDEGDEEVAQKPYRIPGVRVDTVDNKSITFITNNIVKIQAEVNVPYDSGSQARNVYSYYPIPFYFFGKFRKTGDNSYSKNVLGNIDPARHIVLTGGYDTVIYDISGSNPQYNKQNLFKLNIFDENFEDITQKIVAAKSDAKARIKWECSAGFIGQEVTNIEEYDVVISKVIDSATGVKKENASLLGQYCQHNDKIYQCIEEYDPTQPYKVNNKNKRQDKVYQARSFVAPCWQRVDKSDVTYKLTPSDTYSKAVEANYLNNWMRVTVEYDTTEGGEDYRYIGQIFLPINVISNPFCSQLVNDWDGKTTQISSQGDKGYILTSSVTAGHKAKGNDFIGITIGDQFLKPSNQNSSSIITGIFGYGKPNPITQPNDERAQQTLFIDSNTGRTVFGSNNSNQIILDPTNDEESEYHQVWSKINGWYFSNEYFFKQTVHQDTDIEQIMRGQGISPATSGSGWSGGFWIPEIDITGDNLHKPFLWVANNISPQSVTDNFSITEINDNGSIKNSINGNTQANVKFAVTYEGKLYAEGATIQGHIDADSGFIGPAEIKDNIFTIYKTNQDSSSDIIFKVKAGTGNDSGSTIKKDGYSLDRTFIAMNGSVYITSESVIGDTEDIDQYILKDAKDGDLKGLFDAYKFSKRGLEPDEHGSYTYNIGALKDSAYDTDGDNLLFFQTDYYPLRQGTSFDLDDGYVFNYGQYEDPTDHQLHPLPDSSAPSTVPIHYLVLNKNFAISRDQNGTVDVKVDGHLNIRNGGKIGPWILDNNTLGNTDMGIYLHAGTQEVIDVESGLVDRSEFKIGFNSIDGSPNEKYFITLNDRGNAWCATQAAGYIIDKSFYPTVEGAEYPWNVYTKNSQTRWGLYNDGQVILNQSDNSVFRGRFFNYNSSKGLGKNTFDWWGLHLGSEDWYPDHSSATTVGIYLGTEDNPYDNEECVPAVIKPSTSGNGCCTEGHLTINNGVTITDSRVGHIGDYVSINTQSNGEVTFFTAYSGGGGLTLTMQADGLHSYGTYNDGHFIVNAGSGGVAMYPNSIIMAPPQSSTPNIQNAAFDVATCLYPNISASSSESNYIGFEEAVRRVVRAEIKNLHLVNGISTSSTGGTPITNVTWTFYNG